MERKHYYLFSSQRENGVCYWGNSYTEKGTAEYKAWIRNDAMIISWLKNTLTPKIKANYTYVRSAKLLWDNLKEKYGQKNGLLVFQLKQAILNLK